MVESVSKEEFFDYDSTRISKRLISEIDLPYEEAQIIANEVTKRISQTGMKTITPTLIRSFVNVILYEKGFKGELQSDHEIVVPIEDIENIIFHPNKENGNTPHNPESINLALAENLIKQYVLKCVLGKDLRKSHLKGDIHIHDLGMYDRLYCSGHNPEYIKKHGLANYPNIPVDSDPAKSAWVLARHIASATLFFTSIFAGAIGFDSINTFFAPYMINWKEKQYKQLAQTLIFDFAQLAGAKGGQVSFTDLNIYATIPDFYKETLAMGEGGKYIVKDIKNDTILYVGSQKEALDYENNNANYIALRYKDFEKEAQQFCKAILEVSAEGDSRGMPFGFPKIHFHVNKELFENKTARELLSLACKVLSKNGNPYIDFDRGAAGMSQCCRLVLKFDTEDLELTKTPEELRFCGGQNVSINLANLPLKNKTEDKIYEELKYRMDLAIKAHHIKLDFIKKLAYIENSPLKFYIDGADHKPYIKWNKISWLIGIVGLNEYVKNLTGHELHESKAAFLKGLELITYMNKYCESQSKKHSMNFKLEETPAESTAGRFAKLDRKTYGDRAFVKGEGNGIYYTNSIHFPVDANIDYVDLVKYQSKFHPFVTAGSMVHNFVGDKSPSAKAIESYIISVHKNTNCVEATISPNQTVCNHCKTTVNGFHDKCPNCNSSDLFWIARITGYQVTFSNFNESKKQELKNRTLHEIGKDEFSLDFMKDDIVESGVKLYSLTNCPNCKRIKKYCDEIKLNYQYINIDEDYKGKARIVLEDKQDFPIIQINKEFIEYDRNDEIDIKRRLLECLNQ